MALKGLLEMEWLQRLDLDRVELWSHGSVAAAAAATGLLAVVVFYTRRLYRVHFHPLSKFPGPREAAGSESWLYRQLKKPYPEQIYEKLHRDYQARAIRIGPNELHIDDTSLYKVIYRQGSPYLKDEPFYLGFNAHSPTVFTEVDPHKHKERRRMLNPYFSRAGVLKLEGLIKERLGLLEKKIDRLCVKQDIDIKEAIRLFTTNVIMEFCFAESNNMMEEQEDGFSSRFLDAFTDSQDGVVLFQEHPWLRILGKWMLMGLVRALNPTMEAMFGLLDFCGDCVKRWRQAPKDKTTVQRPIVLEDLESLDDVALVAEAIDLLIAGSDTSATSLTVAVLEILSHPAMEKRLVEELDAAIPDGNELPSLHELEKLPYLTACVKEGIRFATAVPGRLPRVVPHDDANPLIVDDKVVPPGTVVSISAYTMHSSVDLWGPDARYFNPERWLAPNAKSLEQYHVAFSKGSRMCLGINLVPVELTIALASLFRKYRMTFPRGFIPPQQVERFVMELQGGLPLKVSRRA